MPGNLSPVQFAGVSGASTPDALPQLGGGGGGGGASSAATGGGASSSSGGSGGGGGMLRGVENAGKSIFNMGKGIAGNSEVDAVAADAAEAAPEIAEGAGIAALAL